MLKLLAAGGFDAAHARANDVRAFAAALGKAIAERNHVLLNGCQTELDLIVAEGAETMLKQLDVPDSDPRILSYVLEGRAPIHKHGRILQSIRKDWDVNTPGLSFPETIELADAVILVGGFDGTLRAANWARFARKPLLPITLFGGAAKQIYPEEMERFKETYGGRVEKIEYSVLNKVTDEWPAFAAEVVALAEKISTSKSVLIIMSFGPDEALVDACESFKEVGDKLGYTCQRIDDSNASDRIIPELIEQIRRSAFVIVDVSEPRPNVYYELGYAHALGKPVVITAKEGTDLPFDVKDLPTVFWKGQKLLKEKLAERIKVIARSQGRQV